MLKLALTDFYFKIDSQELLREGKSYTVDTLKQYRKNYGHDVSLSFIMGHDAFCHFM
jgi:nicotinate-nucleotide adenylyltransferase